MAPGIWCVKGRTLHDSTAGNLQFYNSDGTTRRTVLRHVRMGPGGSGVTSIVQAQVKWISGIDCGLIVNYQDPENFGVCLLDWSSGSNVTPRYVEYVDGKRQATRASGTAFTLTSGNTVTLQARILESSGAQTLDFYVGGTLRIPATGTIDDTWKGGSPGLFRATGSTTTTLEWDDFQAYSDVDASGALSGGDYVYANYNFNSSTWNTIDLTHDDNGNLSGDGRYQYKYDWLNRLVGVWYAAGDKTVASERVCTYAFDGLNRRLSTVVSQRRGLGTVHSSTAGGITGIEAGTRTEHYYYTGWRLIELRDGSSNVLGQFVPGTQYIDEPLVYDRNTDVGSDGNTSTACLDTGSKRYFYHQDANYRVVALGVGDRAARDARQPEAAPHVAVFERIFERPQTIDGGIEKHSQVGHDQMVQM